jgi:hypothetical protein
VVGITGCVTAKPLCFLEELISNFNKRVLWKCAAGKQKEITAKRLS